MKEYRKEGSNEAARELGLISEPPELCELSGKALHCYGWCGGFKPAMWPLYDTLYDVSDWPLLEVVMQELTRE